MSIEGFSNEVSEGEETVKESSQSKDNTIIYVGAVGVAIVGALVYVFNKKKK